MADSPATTSQTDSPQKQQHTPVIIPAIISTTISQLLLSPPPHAEPDSSSANAPALTSSMASWFRKPARPSPQRSSRDSSPSKSVGFSERSSIDGESRRSLETTTTERGRKTKRGSRPKTCFTICYAPPRSHRAKRLNVVARPLLQLHKIETRARPRPELEVLPSAIFSSRLNKAAARFSDSKHSISPSDLAIVRAEKYHEHEASAATDADELRDIVAIISGLSRRHTIGKTAKLHLEGNVVWDATKLPNGGYECNTTDAHGLKRTVRWVAKRDKPAPEADEGPQFKRFNFSTITPGTRRHPVIASLSATGLEISDFYSIPNTSSRADSPAASSLLRSDSDLSPSKGEPTILTSDELRTLIAATAIFVAVCEGWCTGYGRTGAGSSDEFLSRSPSTRSCTSPPAAAAVRPASIDGGDLPRRNSSMRTAMRQRGSRPASPASSSFGLNEKATPPIPETEATARLDPMDTQPVPDVLPRRGRADTVATVIVGQPAPWTGEDETEDEAEEEEEPEQRDRGASAPALIGGPQLPVLEEKRAERTHSNASTARSEPLAREEKARESGWPAGRKEEPRELQRKKKEKNRWRRWRRKLMCGFR